MSTMTLSDSRIIPITYTEIKLLLEPSCIVPENTLRSGVAILIEKTNLRNR